MFLLWLLLITDGEEEVVEVPVGLWGAGDCEVLETDGVFDLAALSAAAVAEAAAEEEVVVPVGL